MLLGVMYVKTWSIFFGKERVMKSYLAAVLKDEHRFFCPSISEREI